MPGKTLSKRKKQCRRRRAKDVELHNAARLWKREFQDWERQVAAHPDEKTPRPSLRKFAQNHKVNRMTLSRYLDDGHITKTESSQSRQKISPEEEDVLIHTVIDQGYRGFPLTHDRVERFANKILQTRTGTNDCVGKNWVDRFIDKHEDQIHTYWSKHLPGNRAGAVNPMNVRNWEDIVKSEVVDAGIQPEDIYGMDETHAPPEFAQMCRVIAGKNKSIQYGQGGSTKETITVLVTICADGTTLRPNVIFKAKRQSPEWFDDNVANAT